MPSGDPHHASNLGDEGQQRLRACKGHSSKCRGGDSRQWELGAAWEVARIICWLKAESHSALRAAGGTAGEELQSGSHRVGRADWRGRGMELRGDAGPERVATDA